MGYVYRLSNGEELVIGQEMFWDGLKDEGKTLSKILDSISKEPDTKVKRSCMLYVDQSAFQDDRAFFYPDDKRDRSYLKEETSAKMFKMLRTFFKEQKYKPYFLNRLGVKKVHEYVTGRPHKNAKEITEERMDGLREKLANKEKLPRKLKKRVKQSKEDETVVKTIVDDKARSIK